MGIRTLVGIIAVSGLTAAPVLAQPARPAAEQQNRELRYQLIQMERTLETAVEHGANNARVKLQAALPTPMLITENAHARGFKLDGYGVFFDIEVPDLAGSLLWSMRTLDQNDLGLQSALKELKSYITSKASGNATLEQALKRIELQVAPPPILPTNSAGIAEARLAAGSPAGVNPDPPPLPRPDFVLSDPDDAFHTEIKSQIMKAMLDYSSPLEIGADEWLTVAARRHDERPAIAPADSDSRTVVMRIRGADLLAFRSQHLSREEAMKRMEVREF